MITADSDLVDILPHPQVNKLGFNVTLVRLAVLLMTFDVQTRKLMLQWSGCLIKVTGAETADEGSNLSSLLVCRARQPLSPLQRPHPRHIEISPWGEHTWLWIVPFSSLGHIDSLCTQLSDSTRLSVDTTISLPASDPALSFGAFEDARWLSNTFRTCPDSCLCLTTIGREL